MGPEDGGWGTEIRDFIFWERWFRARVWGQTFGMLISEGVRGQILGVWEFRDRTLEILIL